MPGYHPDYSSHFRRRRVPASVRRERRIIRGLHWYYRVFDEESQDLIRIAVREHQGRLRQLEIDRAQDPDYDLNLHRREVQERSARQALERSTRRELERAAYFEENRQLALVRGLERETWYEDNRQEAERLAAFERAEHLAAQQPRVAPGRETWIEEYGEDEFLQLIEDHTVLNMVRRQEDDEIV